MIKTTGRAPKEVNTEARDIKETIYPRIQHFFQTLKIDKQSMQTICRGLTPVDVSLNCVNQIHSLAVTQQTLFEAVKTIFKSYECLLDVVET